MLYKAVPAKQLWKIIHPLKPGLFGAKFYILFQLSSDAFILEILQRDVQQSWRRSLTAWDGDGCDL